MVSDISNWLPVVLGFAGIAVYVWLHYRKTENFYEYGGKAKDIIIFYGGTHEGASFNGVVDTWKNYVNGMLELDVIDDEGQKGSLEKGDKGRILRGLGALHQPLLSQHSSFSRRRARR